MFLLVAQLLGESRGVGHRLLGVVLGHPQLVAVILQVSLDNTNGALSNVLADWEIVGVGLANLASVSFFLHVLVLRHVPETGYPQNT